jgi:DNA-binding Xre family transcriptional regulator
MAQAQALIDALKNVLKARGMTYAKLGKGLGLSEASVKRVFAEKSFSLERFDQVCGLLGIQISDLARMVAHDAAAPAQLTAEQEGKLVSDPRLLLIAVHAVNHWAMEEILEAFDFSRAECVRLLARLDKLGIIDLLPNNKIRVRVAPDFSWLPGGPIQQYFRAQLRNDFFNSRFDGEREKMNMVSGMLSPASNALMQQHMRRIAAEFSTLHHQDLELPLAQRDGTSLILAMRPWLPESFKALQKKRQ